MPVPEAETAPVEETLTAEDNLPVAAEVNNVDINNENVASEGLANWTSELKQNEVYKKEKAMYLIGILILSLLAFYTFFLWIQ